MLLVDDDRTIVGQGQEFEKSLIKNGSGLVSYEVSMNLQDAYNSTIRLQSPKNCHSMYDWLLG